MRLILFSLAFGLGVPWSVAASAKDDAQVWGSASAEVDLAGAWRLSQDLVTRFSEDRGGLYEIEASGILGYQISENVTLWAGYVHNPQYTRGDHTVTERRARQQVTIADLAKFGGGALDARLRFEQRWRHGTEGTGWRVRPYVRKIPLERKGKATFNLSVEPFFNLSRTSFQDSRGLDRLRTLAAVSVPLNTMIKLEGGYLNQYGFVRDGEDSVDHVAHVAMSAEF